MTDVLIRIFVKNYKDTQDVNVRAEYGRMAGLTGIVCNVFLCIIKLIAGTLSGSLSITADAINNLSDASSNIISLVGFKMGSRPADAQHPYGHARYEYLAGLSVAVLIMAIGIELLKSSVMKLFHPSAVEFSITAVIVLIISIAVKYWMMGFNRKIGKIIKSGALEATAKDSRNDVLTTSAVLTAALFSQYSSLELDAVMGIGVAVFILVSGFNLIKETLDPLLGKAPDPEYVDYIHKTIMSYEGVLGTHDLMVHDYGPGRQFASVHVEMAAEKNVIESHDIIDRIERDFLTKDNLHMVIHYDPIITSESAVGDLRKYISGVVKSVYAGLSIHDLRLVKGSIHSSVIFDCLVPRTCPLSNSEISDRVNAIVHSKYPDYICKITFDESYAPVQN